MHLVRALIEAAGGVVWRVSGRGRIKVLLVHRPRYGDWSLPKGKLLPGEDPVVGALREVLEETGLHCDAGPELPEVRYSDRKGRSKRARYWAMQVLAGDFTPNAEVDQIRWVELDDVASVLSYGPDATVVAALRV